MVFECDSQIVVDVVNDLCEPPTVIVRRDATSTTFLQQITGG